MPSRVASSSSSFFFFFVHFFFCSDELAPLFLSFFLPSFIIFFSFFSFFLCYFRGRSLRCWFEFLCRVAQPRCGWHLYIFSNLSPRKVCCHPLHMCGGNSHMCFVTPTAIFSPIILLIFSLFKFVYFLLFKFVYYLLLFNVLTFYHLNLLIIIFYLNLLIICYYLNFLTFYHLNLLIFYY